MQTFEDSSTPTDDRLKQAISDVHIGRDELLASIMRQHNQRMFRIARSILRHDADAEDIVQDAFVKAFTSLDTLRDEANMAAWLAKITANLALSRLRQKKKQSARVIDDERFCEEGFEESLNNNHEQQLTPERLAAMTDVRALLEQEIDRLSDGFREVFVLRVVEQMSIDETAQALDIRPETVKTRLHRAKAALKAGLEEHLTASSLTAFPFGGFRCERTTNAVLARLRGQSKTMTSKLHH